MTESTYNGYRRIDFEFEGTEAILVFPDKAGDDKNWLMKMEYFDAFPKFEIEMLKRGYHLAFIKNATRWCLDSDLDKKKRFADFLISEYGLKKSFVPVGMSCGGLIGSKFAAKYPGYVSVLYLDAPVMNFLSCPADLGAASGGMFEEFTNATKMTMSELICYREHPIDKIPVLAENKIPVALIYGDSDTIVPYNENGVFLERYYKERNLPLLCIAKKDCGHHPHGLEDLSPLIEFVEKYDI